ncbi:MAG: dinitrogenase iron-molybdenum cofactor biosynthesis protein [Eggerthellaceae bacterium]|nr:dinitrogenase iron-molybdenum cofactor biosynthesis protein [Eggerthellaceae bacterium]
MSQKIAVPSETDKGLNSVRSGHFGHCPWFTVITFSDDGDIESVESIKNVEHGPNGCGGVIDYVLTLGIDGILTAGMGMPPLTRFTNAGITVYRETETPMVGDVAKKFSQGNVGVMSPDAACRH